MEIFFGLQFTILMFVIDSTLITRLCSAKHLVVFTGAGVSAESGIPTFRDKQTGLWARFDAHGLATPEAFKRDPSLVWGWYEWRRARVLRAVPNPAHLAIAQLAALVPQFTLITQNVDDLHERAGSVGVLHLHGELMRPRCQRCRQPWSYPTGIPDIPEHGCRIEPPACPHCNARIRPGVVWFGENLPEREWFAARTAANHCDALLCVGTSSVVQPAASLTRMAIAHGAITLQINPNATEIDDEVTCSLRGLAGEVLPTLVEMMQRNPGPGLDGLLPKARYTLAEQIETGPISARGMQRSKECLAMTISGIQCLRFGINIPQRLRGLRP